MGLCSWDSEAISLPLQHVLTFIVVMATSKVFFFVIKYVKTKLEYCVYNIHTGDEHGNKRFITPRNSKSTEQEDSLAIDVDNVIQNIF